MKTATKENKKIRIIIVDDHFMLRMGVAASINMEPDMEVIAEASTGRMAIELAQRRKPDVVLMDLRLPEMSGPEATAAICEKVPESRVIVLSTYDGDEDVYRAFQAGARAYLLKTVLRRELVQTIRSVHAGQRYIPPPIAARLADRMSHSELTARELEVIHLIVKGMSNKEIGTALSITEVSVKFHVRNVLMKLGVHDRTQAATTALQRGIVHLQ
jgi:two-component system NarL family response regulator